MSKKSEELRAKEEIIARLSQELAKLFDSIDVEAVDKLTEAYHIEEPYKYSKPHKQILDQALKFNYEKEYAKALALFLELAEHGSDIGAEYAAYYFSEGKGTRKSLKKAYDMYLQGMNNGSIYCRYHVAYCLFYGKGTRANPKEGVNKLEEVAFLGIEDAIWDLIDIYSKGIFVEKDDDVVDFWLEKVEPVIGVA